MLVIYYAIRHIPSNRLFPQFQGPQTHFNFNVPQTPWPPPRLWLKAHYARRWLTNYCKGPLIPKHETNVSFEGVERHDFVLEAEPGTARNRADYLIFPIRLTFEGE